jgi:hypothetical protein
MKNLFVTGALVLSSVFSAEAQSGGIAPQDSIDVWKATIEAGKEAPGYKIALDKYEGHLNAKFQQDSQTTFDVTVPYDCGKKTGCETSDSPGFQANLNAAENLRELNRIRALITRR